MVVAGFTQWAGAFGTFWPLKILRALLWPMPPLHVRSVGALYLGTAVFLLGSALAQTRLQTRTILDFAFVWTGCLLPVTGLPWAQLDLARVQVWYGLGACQAPAVPNPDWRRRTMAWLRLSTSSLSKIDEMWLRTVFSDKPMALAI